uniref:GAF domain-containing protein n=1 Tax=Candidatus Kentrum sp. DK TaxID=2126562 RepID=A0A450RVJ1_9GAMM|nr:MAG: GAF domain-containing protein [Candidatus Kentron sp. DK]
MQETIWVWGRPLDIERDAEIFISRALEVEKLLSMFDNGAECVFVPSPPKWGTTTFFSELQGIAEQEGRWTVRVIDARKDIPENLSQTLGKKPTLLILDELEDIQNINEVEQLLDDLHAATESNVKWILAGDNRIRRLIRQIEHFPEVEDFQLNPLPSQQMAESLVIEPLRKLGHNLKAEVADNLCKDAVTPYLGQRLAELFSRNIRTEEHRGFSHSEMWAFLKNASNLVKDYFDDLVERIIRDDEAPYAIVDLLDGDLREANPSLQSLGITGSDGQSFASRLFQDALKERCTLRKFARRFGAAGNWAEAMGFYRTEIERWGGPIAEKQEILEEAVNACFAAKDTMAFISFAEHLTQEMQPEQRVAWLRKTFLTQVFELIDLLPEKESHRIFEAVVHAINTVTRTGRVRLYLSDANGKRLLCREAIGAFSDEWRKEPIAIDAVDWKITKVYHSGAFSDVPDPQRDKETKQNVAKKLQLYSSWLFPVFQSHDLNTPESPNRSVIGVLCIDNPHHSPDRPGSSEKELVGELLTVVTAPLLRAKAEADRSDLQFRIEQLTSLHEHLLTDDPAEKILERLFDVATKIQPNLSMINVRLVEGYRLDRLGVAGYWPQEKLKSIFSGANLHSIGLKDSFAEPEDKKPIRYVPNVHNGNGQGGIGALRTFIQEVEDRKIDLALGSLLSFRLETPEKYLGMCNFYTNHPYEFLDDEKKILSMIVKQAAVALHNSSQLKAVERQRKALEILNNCIALVNKNARPRELKRDITKEFGQLFEVKSASFVRLEGEKLYFDHTWPEAELETNAPSILELREGVTGWAITSGKSQVVSRKDEEWKRRQVVRVKGSNCCAAVPMRNGDGKVIGALVLETEKEDAFAPSDIQLIEAVVGQVPIAIDNARLVSNLRKVGDEREQALRELESQRGAFFSWGRRAHQGRMNRIAG